MPAPSSPTAKTTPSRAVVASDACSAEVKRLNARLAVHRRRLRYWANLPGVYGPTGKKLQRCHEYYELAKDDAHSIASEIHRLTGVPPVVVDPLRTFQSRWNNPTAPAVLIYPQNIKLGN